MAQWTTRLRIGDREAKLLVTSPEGDDLLKARLPVRPPHPRALLTLLEGVALWSGAPLFAVISAGRHSVDWIGAEPWGDQLWPTESALVQFGFAIHRTHRSAIAGVGDFRDVRSRIVMPRPR
jgi:hypothetical protein